MCDRFISINKIKKDSKIQHKEVFIKISFSRSYKNIWKIKKVTLLLRKLYIRTPDEVRFLMTNYKYHL